LKIAIDSWVLASRFRHMGTYVYARSLISQFRQMGESAGAEFRLFACAGDFNDACRIQPGPALRICNTSWLRRERFWRLGGASLAAAHVQADLLFTPTTGTLPVGVVPVVCMVHDVTPVVLPAHPPGVLRRLRPLLWSLAKFSRHIITNSECSKKDLMSIYGLPESKVSVVYLGYDKTVFNNCPADPELRKDLLQRLGIHKPYIVHHGTIQPRKNLGRLIEAYRMTISRNPNLDLELVLAGPLGWRHEEVLTASMNGNKGRVILTGVLSDADLALLVKGASLAAVPSLYEGFCLPMVEAMACGTPTIAAHSSCLPEVSGRKLLYFDPLSVEEMATTMQLVLDDVQTGQRLAENGKRQAAGFTWQRCAEETVKVFQTHCNQ
jgi:glycosyltransferase involved in cell wall biosynthesis